MKLPGKIILLSVLLIFSSQYLNAQNIGNTQSKCEKEKSSDYSGYFLNNSGQQLVITDEGKGKISYKISLISSQRCACEDWETGEAINSLENPNIFNIMEGDYITRKITISSKQQAVIEINSESDYFENCCKTTGLYKFQKD